MPLGSKTKTYLEIPGVADTRHELEVESNTLKDDLSKVDSNLLDGNPFEKEGYIVGESWSGGISTILRKDFLTYIMEYLGFTKGTKTGTIQEYTLGMDLPDKNLNVFHRIYETSTVGSEKRFNTGRVKNFKIDMSKRAYIKFNMDMLGLSSTFNSALTDDTGITTTKFSTPLMVATDTGADLIIDGESKSANISTASFDCDLGYTIDDNNVGQLAANGLKSGTISPKLTYSGTYSKEVFGSLKSKQRTNTRIPASIKLNSEIEIIFPRCEITNVESVTSGAEELTLSIELKALYDEASQGAVIVKIDEGV